MLELHDKGDFKPLLVLTIVKYNSYDGVLVVVFYGVVVVLEGRGFSFWAACLGYETSSIIQANSP